MAETIKIGGELESTATGNVVAAASAIKDKALNKYQNVINAETNDALANRYTKSEVYNKEQINNMISPTEQQYANYSATAQTTSINQILPAEGDAAILYRVGNWDGTQYNPLVYTEYAWDGTAYVPIKTKNMEQSNVRMSNTIPGMLESVFTTDQPNILMDNNTGAIKMVYEFN